MIRQKPLRMALKSMYAAGVNKRHLKHLFVFLNKTDPKNLIHMNPLFLALHLGLTKYETLILVVQGILAGLFEMEWEVFCPQCQNTVSTHHLLRQLPETSQCAVCGAKFENYGDHNVQISISLHPGLRSGNFPVNKEGAARWNAMLQPVTPLDLLGIPIFREKFGTQVLEQRESIKIRKTTIMFTDLIQSTSLYHKIGDIRAFQLVNDHFQVLFKEIIHHQGGIIKTIGDAVMGILPAAVNAVEAAVHAKKMVSTLVKDLPVSIRTGLKVGIHTGPALIVNLNNTFDLFGTTINIAARLVGKSSHRTIAVSEAIMRNVQVQAFIAQNGVQPKRSSETLRGLPGEHTIFLLHLPDTKSS